MATAVSELVISDFEPVTIRPTTSGAAIEPLLAVHRQLADVVESVSDEQYVQTPVAQVSGSLGGHVRHCLDHVESLLVAARTGQINYDARKRGTAVETSRTAAIEAIHRQERQLRRLAARPLSTPLRLTAMLSPSMTLEDVPSTLGRELAFALSHTIHHSAIIAVMVKLLGLPLPEHFGYAPATIAYLEKQQCAR